MPQPLSSKENSLFRQLVKNYETKQYKKGAPTRCQPARKAELTRAQVSRLPSRS